MGLIIRLVAWISCAIAVALTALRFLQLRQPLAQQALGYLPWTIPLFTLALLVFLAHLFFPGKSRWQITMALAAVSLLGLLLQVWWLSPLFIGDKPVAGPQADPFRVFTLNLDAGSADPNDVVAAAVTSGADIVVLQEVAPSTLARMEQAGLGTAFPHRAGQPISDGAFGTMVFSTAALGDATYLGTTQSSVQVQVGLPGHQVWLLAVAVPPPASGSPEAWLADLEQLTATVGQVHPAIVAGDFEASFEHGPFAGLLDAGLRDVGERANAGWQLTWPMERSRFGVKLPRMTQPDHVLIGSALAALDQDLITVLGSDHRAVLAEVAFR